ncbi:hypothetical protein CDL12_21007 [Handroanthus impetiginosus]|uniref:Uncharacterized protein n=1 Tax=Handroanthus impetiginosus TaxID=429701 RepID=A0A2G9GMF2_9LAMI|nr:hypothetical protein CDL12_21007 [Handroanthus impetiginosus]
MKMTLSWWDLTWFEMGAVIGIGIFILTGLEVCEDAAPPAVLSYVVFGLFALLSVLCYMEFVPVTGYRQKERADCNKFEDWLNWLKWRHCTGKNKF